MSPAVPHIDVSAVRRHAELGAGGQGVVYLVTTLDAPDAPLAYKEYRDVVRSAVDWGALERLVTMLAEADAPTRFWFHRHAAWPARIVDEGPTPCGFLMRLAPRECSVNVPAGATRETLPLAFEFLLNPLEYMRRVDLRISDADRVLVLLELAEVLRRFHDAGIAVGDLSPKNVLVALPPATRCFILDCDAVRRDGASAVPQVETPDWTLPEGEEVGTNAGDIYKFGLFAARLAAADQATYDIAPLRGRRAELAELAERSLSTSPRARPDANDWLDALNRALPFADTAVPELTSSPAPAGDEDGAHRPATAAAAPRQSRRGAWWLAALATAVLAAVCVGILSKGETSTDSTAGSGQVLPTVAVPPLTVPPQAPPSQAPPSELGLVSLADVIDDPRAPSVARMFDAYFNAINDSDYDAALALFDENSPFDPTNPAQRQSFINGVDTSNDSDVRIESLAAASEPGVAVVATVSFQSRQAAGKGPRRDPNETCTRWVVTYSLTEPAPGEYRLLKGTGSSQPC